jgi:hypothetical protein
MVRERMNSWLRAIPLLGFTSDWPIFIGKNEDI